MKIFTHALVLTLAAGLATTVGAFSVRPPGSLPAQKEKESKGAPSTAIFATDKGKFRILLDGKVFGTEEFEISGSADNWIARGTTTAHLPGGVEVKATGQLKLAADGTPIRYDWTAQTQKQASGAVEFANGTAKSSISLVGAPAYMQDFTFGSSRIAVLDNNLYNQYGVLARLYDWKTGGKQSFPVLIPQDMTPGSIDVESIGRQPGDNANYEALRVSSPDLEIMLYVDGNRRLMRLEVPSSKVTIERE